ncbi:hypothetical protein [Streptomyces huasconensis]|uniref:hypothetical protein n=1 Tax=Streptomyces huasconensis TaxID=1854574 RepID=UPI00340A91B7
MAGTLLLDMFVWNPERNVAVTDGEAVADNDECRLDPPYLETPVIDIPVASGSDEYPFLFSASIWWRTDTAPLMTSHGNPGALAVSSVLRRVEQHTAGEHPRRVDFLCHWLEGLLGEPRKDDSGTVTAFATDVRLNLRHEDRRHLEEVEQYRRNVGSWELRREHERDRRDYLGEEVLRSPGSAVVWWLARHEDEIERATDLIGPLSCLSAAANEQSIPDSFRHLADRQVPPAGVETPNGFDHPEEADPSVSHQVAVEQAPGDRFEARGEAVAALLDKMGFSRGSEERVAFVHRLARMMEASGRPQAAENLTGDLVDPNNGAGHGTGERSPVREAPTVRADEPDVDQSSRPTADRNQWWGEAGQGSAAGFRQTMSSPPGVPSPVRTDPYDASRADVQEPESL